MVGRRWVAGMLMVALLPSGCALLGAVAPEPVPSSGPPAVASPLASPLPDEPAPYTLRAAVEPARAFLEERWAEVGNGRPARFRFLEGRCSLGAAAVMIFEQAQAGVPPTHALAFSHDIAAGIISNAWWASFEVADPDADAGLRAMLDGREIPCP